MLNTNLQLCRSKTDIDSNDSSFLFYPKIPRRNQNVQFHLRSLPYTQESERWGPFFLNLYQYTTKICVIYQFWGFSLVEISKMISVRVPWGWGAESYTTKAAIGWTNPYQIFYSSFAIFDISTKFGLLIHALFWAFIFLHLFSQNFDFRKISATHTTLGPAGAIIFWPRKVKFIILELAEPD